MAVHSAPMPTLVAVDMGRPQQKVAIEIFRFGRDANLSIPGSYPQGESFPQRPGVVHHLVWGAGAEE